jgi:choline dehydrogenase-like flavoprotein
VRRALRPAQSPRCPPARQLLQEQVVHDLRGVGENLADHMQVGRKFKTSSPFTLNRQVGSLLPPTRHAPAPYRLFVRALDAAGDRSAIRTVRMRIVR